MRAASIAPPELLERSDELEALERAFQRMRDTRRGRLVLVEGEAGGGKTALLRRFCDDQGHAARLLWGASDGLFTPRPLGPLVDVAQLTGGELANVMGKGAFPHTVAAVLLHELGTRLPTVLVLEDLHWADEATLDVLRLVARRVASVSALVIGSYREHDLTHNHPLRIVLGELATSGIQRLEVAPLSMAGVERLAEPHGVDPERLFRETAGNPFFVTEALAAGNRRIAPTIRDAVLARAARLGAPARALLEAVAVVPPRADLWMLDTLAGKQAADYLGECLASGMLTASPRAVEFRHELARAAIEESLSPNRRLALHRAALATLTDPPTGPPDTLRLAQHADAAGDVAAVLEYAPRAAEVAALVGAHRVAAAQYARVLRFGESLPLETRADMFERRARECYLSNQTDEALDNLRRAIESHRQRGDRIGEARCLRSMSSILWCPGRTAEATQAARDAAAILEARPPGTELARTYAELSRLAVNSDDAEEGRAWAERAIELANGLDDRQIVAYALTNIGTIELLQGRLDGQQQLERSRQLAREAEDEEGVARTFTNLAQAALRQRWYRMVDQNVAAGLAYATEHGFDIFRLYLLSFQALAQLGRGQWTEAAETAALVLHEPSASTMPQALALAVHGTLRARRAEPDPWGPLDEALALAEPSGELARIAPVAAARAEAAWLTGDADTVRQSTELALQLAASRRVDWLGAELACWRRRAGIPHEPPFEAHNPYELELAGHWHRAADAWTGLGCPYEAALARAGSEEEDSLRRALISLQRLGARAAAAIVARRLRERGVRDLPRAPRAATRPDQTGLTPREIDVLELVAQGLRSSDIAERLFLSRKTVDNHVGAILRKLQARSRAEASAEAVRLGLVQLG